MKLLIVFIAIFAICNANPFKEQFQALNTIKERAESARNELSSLNEMAGEVHRGIMSSIKSQLAKRVTRSVQCTVEVTKMSTLLADPTCAQSLQAYFSATNDTTRIAAVTSFCNGCSVNFTTTLTAVANNCNRTEFDFSIIRQFQFYPSFLCAKEGNDFCANVLINLSTQTATLTAQLTTAQLDSICVPCVYKSMEILQKFVVVVGPFYKKIAFLRGLCHKNNGQYCYTSLGNAFQIFNQSSNFNADTIQKLLDVTCSPCFRLVTARLALSGSIPGLTLLSSLQILGRFCRRDAKGFCLVKLYEQAQPYIASQGQGFPCTNDPNKNNTCSENCKTLLNDMIKKGGCCWGIIVDFITDNSTVRDNIIKSLESCAGKAIPPPCSSTSKATVTITYTNVFTNSVSTNQAAFLAAVALDLSLTYGGALNIDVSTAQVTINGNTVTVVIQVVVPSSAVAVYATDATITVSTDNVGQTATSADVTQPISAQGRAADITTTNSSNQLSFGLLLLFLISLFLF